MSTKKIYIVNDQGGQSASDIGAEAQNIDVSRDSFGNIVNKQEGITTSIPLNDFLQNINQTGAKNLIKCILPKGTSYQLGNNFTGIINDDFSITTQGIASISDFLTVDGKSIFQSFLPAGKYTLSGCPEGGSENTYYLSIYVENNGEIEDCKDIGEGANFELTQDSNIRIISYCNINYDLSNLIFKPRITLEDELNRYNNYQQPSMTNEQLTREINNMTVKGVVPVVKGGTGATNVIMARNNLGLGGVGSDGSGPLKPEIGGTGVNSLEELRSRLGFGNVSSADPLGVDYGGTGLQQSPELLVNLASTNSDRILQTGPRPGVTGVLSISNGGTGSTTSPSMRVALGSTSTVNILQPSPRPGVEGVLSITNGGTGSTASPVMLVNLSSSTASTVFTPEPSPGVTGVLPLTKGGTGGTDAATARAQLKAMASTGGRFTGRVSFDKGFDAFGSGNTNRVTFVSDSDTNNLQVDFRRATIDMEKSPINFDDTLIISSPSGTITQRFDGMNTNVQIGGAQKGTIILGKKEQLDGELRFYQSASNKVGILTAHETMAKNVTLTFPTSGSGGIIATTTSPSSKRIKENIQEVKEEKIKKLLDLNIVNFDFKDGYGDNSKNQIGVIAEEAIKIIPEAVEIPEGYDETKPINSESKVPSVDYRKFIPYLIKMVQIQQSQIDKQQKEIEELKQLFGRK